MTGTVHVFGVRHHGPGSARSLAAELTELAPDAVLLEAPAEAGEVAELALDPEMVPPVALLAYASDEPQRSAFWPMAAFSPEWQAIRIALGAGSELRFMDLPAANMLAFEPGEPDPEDAEDPEDARDPIGMLAAAGGFDDPESWWEDVVEHRPARVFDAVTQAMAALREQAPPPSPREAAREAAMRQAIRRSLRDGFNRVAVVCGAWHAPVLHPDTFPPAAQDAELLKGLPKTKVQCTWVPWTNDRLGMHSGYGAGVRSPGWYAHLFSAPDHPIERWIQRVAELLRAEGLDASPAAAVEAVRSASALAYLRGRPFPGLRELDDATVAVLCGGSDLPLRIIERRLKIGDALGSVPESAPTVPLLRDLARCQRAARLKPEALARTLELDLRKPLDLSRSILLHRLRLLGVPWGTHAGDTRRATGTFRETWRLEWRPEFPVRLIEMSRLGTTIEAAATAAATGAAADAAGLGRLTGLVEACLLADLTAAVGVVMAAFDTRAAQDPDTGELMDALGPLVRARRYGTVRQESTDSLDRAIEGLIPRICVGLGPACASLDDDAAALAVRRIDGVHAAISTLREERFTVDWLDALVRVSDRVGMHGLVAGRASRILLASGRIDAAETGRRLSLVLSRGADPAVGAAWLEGFLEGSGMVLLHDPALLGIIDAWIACVSGATFDELLPLLRRTFATFAVGERRQIGARVRAMDGSGGQGASPGTGAESGLNLERAHRVLPVLRQILGIPEAAGER